MELALSCAWLALVAWLILRAFNQRGLLPPLHPPGPNTESAPHITAIVPARDEEANIARCLDGLLAQSYPADRLRVVVVDDQSADATPAIVSAIAAQHPQVCLLQAPPLPPGWIGKCHACQVGAYAVPPETEWLCFLDADVRPRPALLSRALATAQSERLDLLSLAPRQELGSFAERLVMPCGLYLMAFYQDLADLQSRAGDDATATGQFMLVRREVYDSLGGHAAVRGIICEDVALARVIKRAGRRVALHDGREAISARMYTGWHSLWEGVAKNLVDMLGGPVPTVVTAVAATVIAWAAWLIPAVAAVGCVNGSSSSCVALAPALAASAAAAGFHMAGAHYFGIPLWYGLLFPAGYTAGAVMAIDSLRLRLRGQVTWKGRTYP
ncbi:MAG: glycosyltransferase [Hyphomicrobiales bacterium]|nr:glycosyltransferase [Hyphomicrobiales bacterium]MBV8827135.1 glycosyltransferase [Hyphomicrobiales bacterium]MBV9426736.1 glycosyltransferase [Bradyrhizobiaceae bacterium]